MAKKSFTKMIKKSKTNKRKGSTARRTQKRRTQSGGVGFRPDVFTGCKIGGLPIINAHSDCPKNVGPGDKGFAKALYGAGRKTKSNKTSNKKSNKGKGKGKGKK